MRLLILFILSLPLLAQTVSQDIPVLMSGKRGLVRSGLAAGWSLSTPNLLRYSEDFSNAAWTLSGATRSGNTITDVSAAAFGSVSQTFAISAAATRTAFVDVVKDSETGRFFELNLNYITSGGQLIAVMLNTSTGAAIRRSGTGTSGTYSVIDGGTYWRLIVTLANTGMSGNLLYTIYPAVTTTWGGSSEVAAQGSVTLLRAQLSESTTALPYVATTDLQSVASIAPGGTTMVRGANTGASTDDPTVSLLGWTFDSADRVSGLPAKGSSWTTTNCSDVECYTIDSAGNQYVNGVPRRNMLRWSEDFSQAVWVKQFTTVAGATVTKTATGNAGIEQQSISVVSGGVYTFAGIISASRTFNTRVLVWQPSTSYRWCNVTVTTTPTPFSCTTNWSITTGSDFRVIVGGGTGGDDLDWEVGDAITVTNLTLSLGSTALEYQKTTDSREWELETTGNYTGLLTWWGRWNRVLSPGEVMRNYRQWIKPQVNARTGNALP